MTSQRRQRLQIVSDPPLPYDWLLDDFMLDLSLLTEELLTLSAREINRRQLENFDPLLPACNRTSLDAQQQTLQGSPGPRGH